MNSPHWGTHCPEYKVTAVQVTPVEQPWQRQREYRDLNQIPEGLYEERATASGQVARP